ncbi:putative drug resistance transporter [Gordonia namibiensis NBRC 108229]|uniref:Putative drug resistance transporter n=1 Tax=Gordonia namibiensis NBRC 108229 TaxID=1208314 RepID=K6WSM9_9ACTN|nr:DHA2 family efflux MFS transporter permease subunit [Gordonia namibiensis]GAC02411.1 putative drug resistance transporter [Gordonia namibiensis NBRC 108229]
MDALAKKVASVLALGTLMVMLDVTVTVVAIPRFAESFDTPLSTAQWVTTAYTLALVAVMPTSAWTIRRFGAKRVYLTALTVFVLGSALAGLAWNIQSLIVFRAVQGFGGGFLQPVGMTIALGLVDERHRGQLMGWLGIPLLVGPVLGPTAGGLLVDHVGWRSLFLINVPVGLLAITLAARLFPRAAGAATETLDWAALLCLAPGGALMVYGLAQAGDAGEPFDAKVVVPAATGLVLLTVFVVRTLRSPRPLLDLRLLRKRSLATGSGAMLLVAGAYFGSMMVGPIYIQAVRGDSATTAGMIMIAQALTTGVVAQVASRLVDRTDPRRVVWFGISATIVAMTLMTTVLDYDTPYPILIGIGVVMGLGIGSTFMPLMTAALRGVDGPGTGSGTTILTTGNQFASAIGAALAATILTSLFNSRAGLLNGSGMTGAQRLTPDQRVAAAPDLASAVADTYLLTLSLLVAGMVVALWLPKTVRPTAVRASRSDDSERPLDASR